MAKAMMTLHDAALRFGIPETRLTELVDMHEVRGDWKDGHLLISAFSLMSWIAKEATPGPRRRIRTVRKGQPTDASAK